MMIDLLVSYRPWPPQYQADNNKHLFGSFTYQSILQ